jgi:hypothetical protein
MRLPMPFELARTLVVKGMFERRARQKSAARESLGKAKAQVALDNTHMRAYRRLLSTPGAR